eukprot:4923990-Pyramimonas_sp.AAC.1
MSAPTFASGSRQRARARPRRSSFPSNHVEQVPPGLRPHAPQRLLRTAVTAQGASRVFTCCLR